MSITTTQAQITHVITRDGERGTLCGGSYRCRMEGCRGSRLTVKWPDGTRTYPCTEGMLFENNEWRIR